MKKKVLYISIYSVLMALMMAAEAMLVYELVKLNMLPNKYMAAVIGIFGVLLIGTGLLLFLPRKRKGIARQIIAGVLAACTIAGCCYASPKVSQLKKTVEQITTNVPVSSSRSVYVPNDDPAQSLADTAGYIYGALTQDDHCADQVIAIAQEHLGQEVILLRYDNEMLLEEAYNNKAIQAIVLNEEQLQIWIENGLFPNFEEQNKRIYCSDVTEYIPSVEEQVEPIPEPEPVPDVTNTPFVIYLSGMDGYSQQLRATRSDTNILMVVNPTTKQVLMINTPRDYYVVHPWGSGTRDKLTHFGVYGIDCSVDGLELLYDQPINYYIQINFAGFESLIDSIGGITVYSEHAFYADEGVWIVEGENNLDGKGALHFSRNRKSQPGGDEGRGKNQMKVIKAVIQKLASAKTLIANYSDILANLEGMISANIPSEDISKLVKMQLTDNAQWNVLSYSVSGYGDSETTYSMPGTYCYVMRPYQDDVDYAKELITRVIDGEILTQEDMTKPQ